MRLTRLYTRTGDQGTTRAADGRVLDKDSPRVAAYGSVDELNATLGVALAGGLAPPLEESLTAIQNELFDLGADLSTPYDSEAEFEVPRIRSAGVQWLEERIDELTEITGPLENFVLPGGAPGAAALQLARTVCRRAERDVVALARQEDIGEMVVPYLNRLSDLLFAMARYENHHREVAEPLWKPAGAVAE